VRERLAWCRLPVKLRQTGALSIAVQQVTGALWPRVGPMPQIRWQASRRLKTTPDGDAWWSVSRLPDMLN
jgi:hypothetical protein